MPWLLNLKKHSIVLFLVLIYLVADMILTGREIYALNLLPVVLILIYLAFARLDILYFIIVLLTPVSVQLIDFVPSSSIDFAIPTEPMLFGVMILFYYKIIQDKTLDIRIIHHPVTWAILFNLLWMLVTSITSSMPIVSFKFLLARIWFITTYYFLAILVFKKYRTIPIYIGCYVLSMIVVIVFTIIHHLRFGLFDQQAAHIVMSPFFRDHTSYGAILAMLVFGLGGAIIGKGTNLLYRIILWGSLLIIVIALLLSYTRAAWVSVLVSFGVLGLTLFRIRFRYILIAGIFLIVYLIGQRSQIIHKMARNRQASSVSISEHVKSISNITTDESNLERINRWNSALRMFRERPVSGWGPGTYMFKYAPFQNSHDKSRISTDFGDLGNAHSEYIGPLAESGILGSVSIILVAIVSLLTGFRVYQRIYDKHLKRIVLGLVLGLITYLIHGTLNNFLDIDKASALFWGFIAVFVSLDLYFPQAGNTHSASSEELNAQH
jgi:putative inorganic carbon (hco3(-)) transporter